MSCGNVKLVTALSSSFLVSLSASPAFAKNACPPTDYEGLQKLIKTVKPKKLVFFSSWCSDCLVHLTATEMADVILVAAFDKPEKAARTLDKLNIQTRTCVFDNGLTKAYGVKKVPSEIKVQDY